MTDELGVGHIINTYKVCPKCQTADHLEVRNYDVMWRDGDVYCAKCEVRVRSYDAG